MFDNSKYVKKHIDNIEKQMIKDLLSNKATRQYFDLWKVLGHRILDKELITSKNHTKKKKSKINGLMKIYIYELLLVFLTRFVLVFKTIEIDKFAIKYLFEEFKRLSNDEGKQFYFQNDIYDIWQQISEPNKETVYSSLEHIIIALITDLEKSEIENVIPFFYQKILDKEIRKFLGEFYTPSELVTIMIKSIKESDSIKNGRLDIIDLSCGSGNLLLGCINEFKLENIDRIIGIDINPAASLIAKILISLKYNYNSKSCEPLIFCGDTLIALYKQKQQKKNQTGLLHYCEDKTCLINVEFLGNLIQVIIKDNIPKDYHQLRSFIRKNIKNNSKFSLEFPEELQKYLAGHFQKYLFDLLSDRICISLILQNKFNLVIGNPPYLRVQSIHPLWKRKAYKDTFYSAVGHFDLYILFIELGINLLEKNGKLCYVSSNKFMNTNSGANIRRFIINNSNVQLLFDFKDSHFFDAMVLPVIYVLSKNKKNERVQYISIQKTNRPGKLISFRSFSKLIFTKGETDDNFVIEGNKKVMLKKYYTNQPSLNDKSWNFLNSQDKLLIHKLTNFNQKQTLSDISKKIFVGIKTTANYAFINDYSKSFFDENPKIAKENELIKDKYGKPLFLPIIQGANVRKFVISWDQNENGSYIFYPHYKNKEENTIKVIPKDNLPAIIEYLRKKEFAAKLKQREYVKEAGRSWYEIWNPKDPEMMLNKLKIITPDISPGNNFCIDDKQLFIDGTCYIIILKEQTREMYNFVLGILNSNIMEYFHKCISPNQLYAGRYRYLSTNMNSYPIPDVSDLVKEAISDLVENLLSNPHDQGLLKDLNEKIYESFSLVTDEIDYIEDWLKNEKTRLKK